MRNLLVGPGQMNYHLTCPACGWEEFNVYGDSETRRVEDTVECDRCKFTFSRMVPHVCPMCNNIWECDAGTCQHVPEIREMKDKFMGGLTAALADHGVERATPQRTIPHSPREILEPSDTYCPECEGKLVKDMLNQIPKE